MAFKQIRDNVTVQFPGLALAGPVGHIDDQRALVLLTNEGTEILSVNLAAYGLVAPEGHVYIKDWSEGHGVAASLAASGVVKEVSDVLVGPFSSRAVLVRVLP